MSKSSLYAHFRTKDDLAAHYLRGRSEWWQNLVTTELAGLEAGAGTRILRVWWARRSNPSATGAGRPAGPSRAS